MVGVNFTYCPVSEAYKKVTLPVTYCVVFVFGLILNGTLLYSVCCRTKSWSCSVIYLVNLAVADILYVLALPLLIVSYAMDDVWLFGDAVCKAVRFFFYTNLHCSMMFLMCISVHRFLGVCHPIKTMSYRTRRIAMLASALVWIIVITEIFPTLLFTHSGFINNMTVCFDMTSPRGFDQYFPYGMFLTLVGFLLPFVVIVTCYCLMIRSLSRADGSINVGKHMRSKSIRTILLVCLLFVFCFLPYHIMRIVYLFVRVYVASNCRVLNLVMFAYKIWRPIVSFNCCINPILYLTCSGRHCRHLLVKLCKKKKIYPSVCTVDGRERMGNRNSPLEGIRITPGKISVFGFQDHKLCDAPSLKQTTAISEMTC